MIERADDMQDRHADDGALIALLDGAGAPQAEGARRHVEECATCASRLDVLRERDVRLARLLATQDQPAPSGEWLRARLSGGTARRSRHRVLDNPLLRAAAAILVLAGVAAATPIGGFVMRQVRETLHRTPAPAPTIAPASEPAAAAEPRAGTVVAMRPSGGGLLLSVASRQEQGALELLEGDGERVTAQVISSGSDEELLVLPGELRIVNGAGSRAMYRITLPRGLRTVVVIGGDTVFAGVDAGGRTIELRP